MIQSDNTPQLEPMQQPSYNLQPGNNNNPNALKKSPVNTIQKENRLMGLGISGE